MSRLKGLPLVVGVIVGLIASVALSPSATAGTRRMVPIHGDVKCSVGTSTMHFDPALVIFHTGDRRTKSRNTFTALVTACRGTTPADPAPGGITSGLLELKGRLKQNNCVEIPEPGTRGALLEGQQLLRVTWYNASGQRVGRNRYWATRKGLELIYDNFGGSFPLSPIATVPFTSTLRSTAKAFGGEAVSTRVPVDLTDFGVQCGAGPMASIPLLGGEIAIGNPT